MKFLSILVTVAFAAISEVGAFAPSVLPNVNNVHSMTGSKAPFGILKPIHDFSSNRRSTAIFMGWGPDPIWSTAEVASIEPACPSLSCVNVVLNVPVESLESYTVPGQYVQMKIAGDDDAKPIFLAIASPPIVQDEESEGPTTMEFLVKKTDNNDWITAAKEGEKIDMSQVLGNGFPFAENLDGFKFDFPTQNVLFFATGSGIAPIRAAIESGQLDIAKPGEGGRTARLYYGVQTTADMPYAERFGIWERNGIQVVPVISQPENCKTEWEGRTGYVQNALEEDGVPIPRNSGAFLCGVKGMAESIKELLLSSGVFNDRILTNF